MYELLYAPSFHWRVSQFAFGWQVGISLWYLARTIYLKIDTKQKERECVERRGDGLVYFWLLGASLRDVVLLSQSAAYTLQSAVLSINTSEGS
jgi:hypothetical protein